MAGGDIMRRLTHWAKRGVLMMALVVTAFATSGHAPDAGWVRSYASVYGDPSRWDCGVYVEDQCRGYWFPYTQTSHYWHCDWSDRRSLWSGLHRGRTFGVAHRTAPLGSWMEIQVPTPDQRGVTVVLARVIDRGPYAPWDIDMTQPLVNYLGFTARDWGVQPIIYRLREDLPRFCPQHGYGTTTERPPLRAFTPEG